MRNCLITGVFAVLAAMPAHAGWRVAESAHFIVYGDMTAQSLAQRVEVLEDYRNLLDTFTTAKIDDSAPKLTIYLVDTMTSAVPFGRIGSGVAGYYRAGDRGIVAYASKGEFGQAVLLHEYAHHHMFASTGQTYPAWYVEGFAEYFMTATFGPTRVDFGKANVGRANSLVDRWLPWERVIGRGAARMNAVDEPQFYAQSWLLTHYLFRTPGMAEKLGTHLRAIAKGSDPLDAFKAHVEPDLKALTTKLQRYATGSGFTFSRLTRDKPPAVAVTVRDLPASADDLLMMQAALDTGGWEAKAAPAALAQVRAAAARHPGDALARRTLAMAELYLGDAAAALPILNDLIASAPADPDLLRLQAETLLDIDANANRSEARRLLARAFKAAPGDWRALHVYVHTHDIEHAPVDDALFGVVEKMWSLAPQVPGIVIDYGVVLMHKGRSAEAARVLEPVAFAPHGGILARWALQLRERALAGDIDGFVRVLNGNAPTEAVASP